MMFLTCLDCRIQADDVAFRKKGIGAERPNSAPRCESCIHKKHIVRRDTASQQYYDRNPAMVAKKAIRQERAAERDTEQRRQEDAAKAQAYKKTVAQFKQSKKQARIDKNAHIDSVHEAIIAKYCAENPDFTPGVARDGYAF